VIDTTERFMKEIADRVGAALVERFVSFHQSDKAEPRARWQSLRLRRTPIRGTLSTARATATHSREWSAESGKLKSLLKRMHR
jgi:hypothetical protein